jgi:hypothetical protein
MKEQLIEHIRKWEDKRGEAPNVFHRDAHTLKRSLEDICTPLGSYGHERATRRPFT